jgi:hypothetical protein
MLEAQIVSQQGEESKKTDLCLQYKLCDPAKLKKTYGSWKSSIIYVPKKAIRLDRFVV